jgi:hypothetical protein
LYDKNDTASPTVATDALIIILEAFEGRDVATADVAGAYLKADMKDFVVMKFTGQSLAILCKMNQDYTGFVDTEGNEKVLYVRLVKALYGCVYSALLWYELFTTTLKDMGFVLNRMTTALLIAILTAANAPLLGMWMIPRYPMPTQKSLPKSYRR